MRCVAVPAATRLARPPTPERAALDAVRHLAKRFPTARLREAPLVRAPELDMRADPTGRTRVWLALEALQVTGSFKVRGALVALDANRSRGHVVAASAGNHGVGIAYAANVLGMSATVCVPRTVPQTKRARIEKYGAKLVVAPSGQYDDVEDLAKEIALAESSVFISPYNDVDVVRGNGSSLGFEIVRALGGVPERVLVPFGGGGLGTGLSWALAAEARGSDEHAVWGVQSEACCAMAASIEQGRAVVRMGSRHAPDDGARRAPAAAGSNRGGGVSSIRPLPDQSPNDPATLAEGLAGGIATEAFERAIEAIAGILVATESQIATAMVHAYREMGLVVEGTAAVALAPVLLGLPEAVRGGDLVVVLTGRNVDPQQLASVLRAAQE